MPSMPPEMATKSRFCSRASRSAATSTCSGTRRQRRPPEAPDEAPDEEDQLAAQPLTSLPGEIATSSIVLAWDRAPQGLRIFPDISGERTTTSPTIDYPRRILTCLS